MKLRWLLGFLFLTCLAIVPVSAHPEHFSVLNIEYDAQASALRFTFRLFRDDMELAIYHNYAIQVSVDSSKSTARAEQLMNRYMWERFRVDLAGQETDSLHFDRKVNDGLELWLYYTMPVKGKPGKMTVKDALMTDLFFDQTNLVICGPKGKEKAYQLSYESVEFTHEFSEE